MKVSFSSIELNYSYLIPTKLESNDTVLLFLHEALGSIGQWKDFPQMVCDSLGLNGIVYERQGHGESSELHEKRSDKYLHNYALEELPRFLEEINEKRKVLLVGHSDGGTIALLFAAQHPDKVAGVVTMAAHVINEPETVRGIAPAIQAFEAGKLEGLKKYHGSKTSALFFAWADIWRDATFQNWNISNEIEAPALRGLFLQGQDDQYGTPKQLELIERGFKGESTALLLESCGHHPHLEQKDEVIHHISTWWRQVI